MWLRFAFCSMLMASGANAAMYDGNKHHELCTINPQFVLGYVAGHMDKAQDDVGISSVMLAGDQRLTPLMFTIEPYCLPETAKLGQAVDVYCKYLRDNPGERHRPSAALLGSAFAAVWA